MSNPEAICEEIVLLSSLSLFVFGVAMGAVAVAGADAVAVGRGAPDAAVSLFEPGGEGGGGGFVVDEESPLAEGTPR